ncbi:MULTISPECIES: hypothetical protein [unclassified Rhizobium]|uniref:hypothetical protein n=1 Tax=unclassified Rhizobium TaxID=2613769 RepID=UPI001C83E817|nr:MULTISPECIES: hypothetical protein [unclassified Rhizobium]MBX5215600.1 hypothetical protein [Rhizobium sp. NLR9a]MBX5232763.1 hypothetical protein [Rhizobium sp. NLR4a]MBX5245397.1 hypothetical protein [Rhizobium sp. NLR3b]MBX5250396.1 hypothetical protein [Rhizobium sp. NLR4b]MBX5269112.1 hypothetical protein [Rhizobium sp. NLR17b]
MSVVMNLALLFGALTLTCWMMGGAVAVLGTAEHPRHHLHQLSEFVSLGFNVLGIACAIAIIALVIAA